MTILANGTRLNCIRFKSEKDFEDDVVANSKLLFGESTIYINAKKKIDSRSLGSAIPDGFFFDFSDPTDPRFYLVEVELIAHNFFGHVFPQITKFFAFFKNTKLRKTLVDKLFTLIDTDPALKAEFKKYLAHTEVYKFLSDIVESSQNILLIADGQFHELAEIIETYTDTWGKMVKRLEIRKFVNGPETVYSINPDFDTLEYLEAEATGEEGENGGGASTDGFTESFHLDDTSAVVRDVYARVKKTAKTIDARFTFNPQKYYISIKAKKNIAFIKFRKKKIRFVVLLPESDIRAIISKHDVVPLSEPVQDFYNGQCAAIDIPDVSNFGEIEALLKEMAKRATWAD